MEREIVEFHLITCRAKGPLDVCNLLPRADAAKHEFAAGGVVTERLKPPSNLPAHRDHAGPAVLALGDDEPVGSDVPCLAINHKGLQSKPEVKMLRLEPE